ncbi:hypothetical protein MRX96_028827 [Rhipicephalus microplus]
MGDINRQLRDYLSRNEAKKESSIFASTESLKKLLSSSSGSSEPSSNVAGSNGWFSEAADDSCLPSLSRKQRIVGFAGMLLMGCFCMVLAGLYIPVLVFKARKFALLYTLGSLFIISSFALLRGPNEPCKATVVAEAASIYDCLLWDHICNTLLRIGGQKHTIDGAVHNMPVRKHNLVCARLDPWWRDLD